MVEFVEGIYVITSVISGVITHVIGMVITHVIGRVITSVITVVISRVITHVISVVISGVITIVVTSFKTESQRHRQTDCRHPFAAVQAVVGLQPLHVALTQR